MDFQRVLSDSKFPQVYWTLLCNLTNLNNVVVKIVSTYPLSSSSSSPFTKLLGIVPSASITVGITVTFTLHSFFNSLARSWYLPLFDFLNSPSIVRRDSKVHYLAGSLYCWLSLGLVLWPGLGDLYVSQNSRELCPSHSPEWILGFACTTW